MRVKCEVIVEIDDNELENAIEENGYDDVYDYLNDCEFIVNDLNGNDIVYEVRDYEEIN